MLPVCCAFLGIFWGIFSGILFIPSLCQVMEPFAAICQFRLLPSYFTGSCSGFGLHIRTCPCAGRNGFVVQEIHPQAELSSWYSSGGTVSNMYFQGPCHFDTDISTSLQDQQMMLVFH